MNSQDQEKKSEGSPLADWMKSAMDFWLSAASAWPGVSNPHRGTGEPGASERENFKTRSERAWQQPFNFLQMLVSSFGGAEDPNAFFAGSGVFPDIMMRMLRSGYDGYSELYKQWLHRLAQLGESDEPYRYENLDEDMFKAWMDIYQKEIQPVLNAPQLGLNRFYQERIHQTIDKYNLYQAALAELMRLLSMPLEKSLRVMESEIERLAAEGKLSDNFKDYYSMWIKVLEGHYMTLFKSPDYLDSLVQTLNTVQDFKLAQHRMLVDMLQVLPIPTNRDMDEVYKEIYLLKKKVKQLSSQVETFELSASKYVENT